MYFEKKVDRRSRNSMIDFLQAHFRYDTMNGWNRSTSYAHCIKVNKLGLSSEQEDQAYKVLDTDFWDDINYHLDEFTNRHHGSYTIGTNGRSGGYLVLYHSSKVSTGHKSRCCSCGQLNYKSVLDLDSSKAEDIITAEVIKNSGLWVSSTYLEQSAISAIQMDDKVKLEVIQKAKRIAPDVTIGNKCGRCGQEGERGRVNLSRSPMRLDVYSGRSMDQGESFDPEEWSMHSLRQRVDLVCDFDRTCDQVREAFIELLDTYEVQEVTEYVPKQVKVLVERGASA